MSVLQEALPDRGDLLDLGCGPRDQALPVRHLGFRYVGIDIEGETADLLADAHAIPFRSGSFDAVLAYAIFEHLQNPFDAVAEVARVLRPGGVFVGVIAQGEPFHASYFHHTAWGIASLVASADDLTLVRLWKSRDTLAALATMGRYPRLIRIALAMLHRIDAACPWLAPRRLRWSERERQINALHRAGSICFLVRKAS